MDSSGFRRALAITVVVVGLSGDSVECCLSSSPITELFVLFEKCKESFFFLSEGLPPLFCSFYIIRYNRASVSCSAATSRAILFSQSVITRESVRSFLLSGDSNVFSSSLLFCASVHLKKKKSVAAAEF